jgi:hypothetical protein
MDIDAQAIYEAKLHNWLIQEKKPPNMEELKTEDVNNLTVNIMTRKFNESFSSELLPEQSRLLQDYVFSIGQDEKVSKVFKNRKRDCLRELSSYSSICDNNLVQSKIELVQEKIKNLPIENISDDIVSRYLTVMKLSNELRS